MGSSFDSGGRPLVLLTGATGYIGGRLLKGLEKAGWPVRCLARHLEFLQPRVAPNTEVVKGGCLDQASLPPVMSGVHTAYYLVHSMGSPGKFEEQDRQAARNFAVSARQAGVRRIIYLGGLGAERRSLVPYMGRWGFPSCIGAVFVLEGLVQPRKSAARLGKVNTADKSGGQVVTAAE